MGGIKKNTIGMFDCLKGAVIIWVVLSHSFTDIWVINNCTDYSFIWKIQHSTAGVAMGALLVISGYGFRPVKNWKGIKAQVKMLLKPILLVYVFAFPVKIIVNLISGRDPFYKVLEMAAGFMLGESGYARVFGIKTETISVFWYFLALFLGWMILSMIFRFIEKEAVRGAAVLVCGLAGWIGAIIFPNLPYCINPAMLTVGFLYFGYLLKKKKLLFEKIPFWIYAATVLGTAVTILAGHVNISAGTMHLGMIDYAGTLCGCFLVLKIYLMVFDPENKIFVPFMFVGRNTLLFISLHGFECLTAGWGVFTPLISSSVHLTAMFFFCARLLLILLLYYIVNYFRKRLLSRKLTWK